MAVPMRVPVVGGPPNDDVSRLAVPFRRDEGGRGPRFSKREFNLIPYRSKNTLFDKSIDYHFKKLVLHATT